MIINQTGGGGKEVELRFGPSKALDTNIPFLAPDDDNIYGGICHVFTGSMSDYVDIGNNQYISVKKDSFSKMHYDIVNDLFVIDETFSFPSIPLAAPWTVLGYDVSTDSALVAPFLRKGRNISVIERGNSYICREGESFKLEGITTSTGKSIVFTNIIDGKLIGATLNGNSNHDYWSFKWDWETKTVSEETKLFNDYVGNQYYLYYPPILVHYDDIYIVANVEGNSYTIYDVSQDTKVKGGTILQDHKTGFGVCMSVPGIYIAPNIGSQVNVNIDNVNPGIPIGNNLYISLGGFREGVTRVLPFADVEGDFRFKTPLKIGQEYKPTYGWVQSGVFHYYI